MMIALPKHKPSGGRAAFGEPATLGVKAAHAKILEFSESGEILVEVSSRPRLRLWCDCLQVSDSAALTLQVGSAVLVTLPENAEEKGFVLGRVGPYRPPEQPAPADTSKVVLEADKELELRCGEASITLNANGQVLIKGTDVVSRAKRNQRIKGGSVQIN